MEDLIKPFIKFNTPWIDEDITKAEVFIKGPLTDIHIADFDFNKKLVRVYGEITPLLLLKLHHMYDDAERDVNKEAKK